MKERILYIFKQVAILFCLTLMFVESYTSMAQCIAASNIYTQSTTIPYCATGPCTSQNINIDMGSGCANIVAPFTMEVLGGIELVTPGNDVPTRVGNLFTIAVRPVAGSICKGRVIFRYWRSTDPCNDGSSYPVTNQVFLDVFKSGIPAAALNTIYANNPVGNVLGSPFRIVAETPACITPSDIFNLSVYSVFNTCLADGIGLDEINWDLPTITPGFGVCCILSFSNESKL